MADLALVTGATRGIGREIAVELLARGYPLHKLAREVEDEGVTVQITDPGLTATAPGMAEMGARPVRHGALSVLAPVGTDLPSGSFTRDGRPLPW